MKADSSSAMILGDTIGEFMKKAEKFHGSVAPGLLIGAFMVDLAVQHLPAGGLYDVLCETSHCLPDAVQMLTPCTIGNGWLKIIDTGRFAMTFYDKTSGEGLRVFLDPSRLDEYDEIKAWFFRLKPKHEQSGERLIAEIAGAAHSLYSLRPLSVRKSFLERPHKGRIALCPECGEAYPSDHGPVCRGCRGALPFD
jgi:formylmethanofuran dehydrogenase subunit E